MHAKRAMHGFVQVLVQVHAPLNCLFQEETSVRPNFVDACIRISLPGTSGGLFCYPMVQQEHALHTFPYKHTVPAVTFYDVKPHSVKTPVAAKPSGISPNDTCQGSLVILKLQYKPKSFFHWRPPLSNDYFDYKRVSTRHITIHDYNTPQMTGLF